MKMMNYPKISIITPSYNQGQFLEATIQSVLSQNYPNLEYIIIDGGSTDGSVEIIQKYADHLKFWCSEPDGGQYDAINRGFSHATGEIMAWLNSDDMYFPWAFRTVASIMSALPEVEWLTNSNCGIWDWEGFCGDISKIPGYSREAFLDGRYLVSDRNAINWIQQESTFWKRGLWERIGGYISTEFKLASDFDLWSRFYAHADLYGTSSLLGGFRSQNTQRSRQIEEYISEAQKSLEQMRNICNWKSNPQKETAFHLRLHKTPKVKELITNSQSLSYQGKRVVRKLADSPEGYWKAENHQFA
jgi:glycosyltransferase involved in cell wall biosynthesis